MMERINFNDNWTYKYLGDAEPGKPASIGRVEAVVSDGVRECRIGVNGREEYDA